MQNVTIITDYGRHGYRRGALAGALIKAMPSLQLIDVSHEVAAFDIDEASFILRAIHKEYPKGTIHLVCVAAYYSLKNRVMFFEKNGQFYVGPDNGIFSLVFEQLNVPIHAVELSKDKRDFKKQVARIIGLLSTEAPLIGIGPEIKDMRQKLALQPVITTNQIRGSVIFVDRYGNAVTNIEERMFYNILQGRNFSIYFKQHDPIHRISQHYMEEEIGGPLCNFNGQGLMEVAVNLGRASSLLGLEKGDAIHIEFED